MKSIQGATARSSAEESDSDQEQQQTSMATSKKHGTANTAVIDPQKFIQCFQLALEHESVITKLANVFLPLLESRDKKIEEINNELVYVKTKHADLESRLENLEQLSRNNSIIISGVEDNDRENIDQCEEKVLNILKDYDLEKIDRLRPRSKKHYCTTDIT